MSLNEHQKGLAAGVFCFLFWGIAPVYFKFLKEVPAISIIAHRIIWGAFFLFVFLLIRDHKKLFQAMKISPRQFLVLCISGLLVSSNWVVFVWAVTHDQILATSLGYFINPLINILLGMLFLQERLSKPQVAAVLIASGVTIYLGIYLKQPPWIALFLAITFGLYGLIRKKLQVRPLIGLFWETLILIIPAIVYLLYFAPQSNYVTPTNLIYSLLFFAGLVTVLPLVSFNYAAHRLSLTLIGFLQYIGPSLSFLVAVIFYGEDFTFGYQVAFGGIWLALIIVSWKPFKRLVRSGFN